MGMLKKFIPYTLGMLLVIASSCNIKAEPLSSEPPILPDKIVGDIGGSLFSSNLNIGSYGTQSMLLPYGFFDYERFAMRIDQVAVKTVPIAYGYLEFVGKIDINNYKVKSTINGESVNKGNPVPIGIGTFQETPIGAFFINAYYDFGKSQGNLLEFNYFGEIELPKKIIIYPQVGVERQSNSFANYYYSVTQGQSQILGYKTFNATSSVNPIAGFLLEVPVIDDWFLNLYGKRKWLGAGINDSPVLVRSFQDTIFLSLAYRFK